jgi:hypothetical protein
VIAENAGIAGSSEIAAPVIRLLASPQPARRPRPPSPSPQTPEGGNIVSAGVALLSHGQCDSRQAENNVQSCLQGRRIKLASHFWVSRFERGHKSPAVSEMYLCPSRIDPS